MTDPAPDLLDHPGGIRAALIDTVETERAALDILSNALSHGPLGAVAGQAVDAFAAVDGRVIVTGLGKSGLIARKIAATLSSTGTPALFLHAADASHGDLGTITAGDAVLALSWSGETVEVVQVARYCRRAGVPLVAMTAATDSRLARDADIALVLPEVREACPHQLVPTGSAIVQLALGDAIAIALMRARGLSAGEFRRWHPAGALGQRLRPLSELMRTGAAVPKVGPDTRILDAVVEMSGKRMGCTAVVGDDGALLGAFTDGDLRRSLAGGHQTDPVARHMSTDPHRIDASASREAALAMMRSARITTLFICRDGLLLGAVHLHDLIAR